MGKACSLLCGRDYQHDDCLESLRPDAKVRPQLPATVSEKFTWRLPAPEAPSPLKPLPPAAPLEGRRRSLLVGINYYETQDELHGCVNDVKRMLPVLSSLGFPSDTHSQRVLTDEPRRGPEQQPTRANILAAMAWLLQGARPGDVLFFHYSGHGGRAGAGAGDLRETLVPVDFESAGLLDDRELAGELLEKLPSGCRLTCLFDSCHGSAAPLALPCVFRGHPAPLAAASRGSAARGWAAGGGAAVRKPLRQQEAGAEVLVITGCHSSSHTGSVASEEQFCLKHAGSEHGSICIDQSRAVGGSNWGAGGALTSVFLEVLGNFEEEPPTLLTVLEKIKQDYGSKGYAQSPLLAASRPLALHQRFALDTPLAGVDGC